jgi:hypothetical protein
MRRYGHLAMGGEVARVAAGGKDSRGPVTEDRASADLIDTLLSVKAAAAAAMDGLIAQGERLMPLSRGRSPTQIQTCRVIEATADDAAWV